LNTMNMVLGVLLGFIIGCWFMNMDRRLNELEAHNQHIEELK